jgi:hypothetical protein
MNENRSQAGVSPGGQPQECTVDEFRVLLKQLHEFVRLLLIKSTRFWQVQDRA